MTTESLLSLVEAMGSTVARLEALESGLSKTSAKLDAYATHAHRITVLEREIADIANERRQELRDKAKLAGLSAAMGGGAATGLDVLLKLWGGG